MLSSKSIHLEIPGASTALRNDPWKSPNATTILENEEAGLKGMPPYIGRHLMSADWIMGLESICIQALNEFQTFSARK
jgi:hypothetical protein